MLVAPAAHIHQYCMGVVESPDDTCTARGPGAPRSGRKCGPAFITNAFCYLPCHKRAAWLSTSGQLGCPFHTYQRPQARALGHASCKPHVCSAQCSQALKNVPATCSTNAPMILSRTPRGIGVSQRQQHAPWATANPALDPKHPSCRAWCLLAQSLHAAVDTAMKRAYATD